MRLSYIGDIATLEGNAYAQPITLSCPSTFFFGGASRHAAGNSESAVLRDPSITLLSISGHKFGAARGTGVLIQRRGVLGEVTNRGQQTPLPALICGGPQEHGCRAGTENVAGAVGLATALELAEDSERAEWRGMLRMREQLEDGLTSTYPECVIHGVSVTRAAHITNVAFPGYLARDLQKKLDRKGISCGLGSACTGCQREVSHVLKAMGVSTENAEATLRFSKGWNTVEQEIIRLLTATVELLD